ncbi:hypothetical protein HY230_07090 [Candidatus Acetothermia bacterium]|nr:hypothetical protein [Candidatus Acetothermia bacterium]
MRYPWEGTATYGLFFWVGKISDEAQSPDHIPGGDQAPGRGREYLEWPSVTSDDFGVGTTLRSAVMRGPDNF